MKDENSSPNFVYLNCIYNFFNLNLLAVKILCTHRLPYKMNLFLSQINDTIAHVLDTGTKLETSIESTNKTLNHKVEATHS